MNVSVSVSPIVYLRKIVKIPSKMSEKQLATQHLKGNIDGINREKRI